MTPSRRCDPRQGGLIHDVELGRKHSSGLASNDDCGEDIEMVVAHIRRLVRTANLEYALRVGAVIIHHFYNGDMNAWRTKGPKTTSFRQLARHPELPLSAGSLYRCVALFELCERLNAASRWSHLGASHLRQVLSLPPNVQERVLTQANQQRWSVKVLQREVLSERCSRVTAGGRRATPPVTRSLRSIRKCLEAHRETLQTVAELSETEREESMTLIEEARRCLDRLSAAIQVRHSGSAALAATAQPRWMMRMGPCLTSDGDSHDTRYREWACRAISSGREVQR